MNTADIQKALIELETARAFIDRAEFSIRALLADKIVVEDSVKAIEAAPTAAGEVQDELFDTKKFKDFFLGSGSESAPAEVISKTTRGEPTLTRAQVLALFNQIADGKQLLDRADVNQIFGYSRTTNGTFIAHAIKRGELGFVPCGAQKKFLPVDVKNFIKSYFDRKVRSSKTKKGKTNE